MRALNYVGITDYQILDPAHDEIGREFCLVLYVGQLPAERLKRLEELSQKAWNLPAPDPNASKTSKGAWLKSLESIKDYILDTRERDSFKKADVPDILQLKDFLNSKIGQVVEVTLPDRRRLGIYPDNHRLPGDYDVEYHASSVVNIAKLFKLFDATELIIKEL